MKQVLQFRRSGETRVVDVPAPLVPPNGLLVHNRYSLISSGTERMLVEASGANLFNTARHRPDLVAAAIPFVKRPPRRVITIRYHSSQSRYWTRL